MQQAGFAAFCGAVSWVVHPKFVSSTTKITKDTRVLIGYHDFGTHLLGERLSRSAW